MAVTGKVLCDRMCTMRSLAGLDRQACNRANNSIYGIYQLYHIFQVLSCTRGSKSNFYCYPGGFSGHRVLWRVSNALAMLRGRTAGGE